MPDGRDELERKREALRQELSTLKEAIVDIDMGPVAARDRQQLETLRTVQARRERELNDIEGRLASIR